MTAVENSDSYATLIRRHVAEIAAFEPHEINDDDAIYADLGLDSIMMLDLLATLSTAYPQLKSITTTDVPWQNDMTYRDLESHLHRLAGVEPEGLSSEPRRRISDISSISGFLAGIDKRNPDSFFRPHQGIAAAEIELDGQRVIKTSVAITIWTQMEVHVLQMQ